ncbi:MAG: ComF family protein [Nitrospirales bacterium]|nr:ComF family protein [Nitrospirales bacterium]
MRNYKPKKIFRKILHAVLPANCRSCGEALWGDSNPFFCDHCWSAICPIMGPTCQRCSLPFSSQTSLLHSPIHQCANCRLYPPAFTRAWTFYPYKSPLKEAIGLFKYRGKVSLAGPLATLFMKALTPLPKIDVILPVPLHPIRLREREYNQSLLLAFPLSTQLCLPISYSTLVRIRPTTPQTSLKRKARIKNLRRSFVVTQPTILRNKSILLVDDVFTTGTTVNECAKALRKAGVSQVYVVTLARMV